MLTQFAYRLLAPLLLIQSLLLIPARAQVIKPDKGGASCELTPKCEEHKYEFFPGSGQTFLRWQVRGDVKLLSPDDQNPAVICSDGYGKGRITAHYYILKRKKGECGERCPDTAYYALDYDVFKQFKAPFELMVPACVLPGQRVTFAVPPILTDWPHRSAGIGTDSYFWAGFPAGSQLWFSGDSSSVTVDLPAGLASGFQVEVGVGRCNRGKPLQQWVGVDKPLAATLTTICPAGTTPGSLGVSIGTLSGVTYQVILPAGWQFANGSTGTLSGNGMVQNVYFACDGSAGNVLITATGGCSGVQTTGLAFTIVP